MAKGVSLALKVHSFQKKWTWIESNTIFILMGLNIPLFSIQAPQMVLG
jgi:hypothetical protein